MPMSTKVKPKILWEKHASKEEKLNEGENLPSENKVMLEGMKGLKHILLYLSFFMESIGVDCLEGY